MGKRIHCLQHCNGFDPVSLHQPGDVHRMVFSGIRVAVKAIYADCAVKLPLSNPSGEGLWVAVGGFHGVQNLLSDLLSQLPTSIAVKDRALPQVLPLVVPVGPLAGQVGGVGEQDVVYVTDPGATSE